MPGNNYADERSISRLPACGRSQVFLTFDGMHLRTSGTRSVLIFRAVSGKMGEKGLFDYSVDRQRIRNVGPIPAGEYWIQPSEMWENNWFKSFLGVSRAGWGNFRITIHPYPNTETYSRGGFFIHGGNAFGSAGCIDLAQRMDQFVERLKKELNGLPECHIPLTVRYHP